MLLFIDNRVYKTPTHFRLHVHKAHCQTLLKLLGYNLEKIPQETENYCKYRHTACIPGGQPPFVYYGGGGDGLGVLEKSW